MARPLRIQFKNALYHITSRGNERKEIFHTISDKYKFIEYLKLTKKKFRLKIYAYVLMNNHYHLLLETELPNLSSSMHYLNTSYTTYFNLKIGRSGHLLEGRYKSILVEKDSYLLELTRYIHLNPIRANIVDELENYPFSSYKAYTNGNDDLIDTEDILLQFSKDKDKARFLYQDFVKEGLKRNLGDLFDRVVSSYILGSERFVDEVKKIVAKEEIKGDVSRKKELTTVLNKDDILNYVVGYYKISLSDLYKNSKVKKIVIYLLKENTNLRLTDIGKIFKLSYSAVSQIVRRINKSEELKKDILNIKKQMI